ncbi:UDP-glucuronic acid decarboxylase 1 [Liparis tanakae]|uniref:UDP-glucuronic acid decarboxylase 1 n=1 Tax=Liparis tanakae TaxID=230148 RepID=A0A4Z2EE56_9TELE|nr:UDP-glucuronic acid decarboxylase 1 [Liparis tanakae]
MEVRKMPPLIDSLVLHYLRLPTSPVMVARQDPEVHPQNEEYWGHVNPIGPRACYDEGKRVAETMCYAYMKQVRSAAASHDARAPEDLYVCLIVVTCVELISEILCSNTIILHM